MESRYDIIKSFSQVKRLVKACLKTGIASVDFETNAEGIYNKTFKPTILSVTFQVGSGVSIPLCHHEYENPHWKRWLKYFGRKVVENPNITKVGWNLKFDLQIFELYGIYVRGTVLDGMLMKYLLNEEKPNDLKSMVRRYLPEHGDYEKAEKFDKIPWDKKPLEPLCKYGCQDTDYTLRLAMFFESKLIEIGMYPLFRHLIMPASRVLQHAEKTGLYLDRKFNQELLESYKPKIEQATSNCLNLPRVKKFSRWLVQERISKYLASIESELEDLDYHNPKDARKIASREQKISNIRAGVFTTKKELELTREVNLGSTIDLPLLLYSEKGFKFPIIKYTKDKKTNRDTDKPSTDEDTLVELRLTVKDPESPKAIFLDNLLELRGLKKMYTTYIEGWHDKVQDDDRIHGQFKIIGTTSGRLSSSEPNLQQIPKTSVDANIKKQLVAPKGKLYMALDYSQAELRIMAHLSGDETYLEAFAKGQDPHLAIAANKYGVSYEEANKAYSDEQHPDYKLWKNRRKQAKQICFGIIYGIQKKLLAVKLSDPKAGIIVTPDEAQQQLNEFFQEHPKIKKFMINQEKVLIKHGYIKSLFGRKRRLPQVYSDNEQEAAYAVRLSVNMPCQSAASDMNLFASILNYWKMRQGKLPFMQETCNVHDATYYLVSPEYINTWVVYEIWETCRNPNTKEYFNFQIDDVSMSMDFVIGRSMAEELPFIPGYDYRKMLEPDFNPDEYLEEHRKFKGIEIEDYPKLYPEEIEKNKREFRKRMYER
jgi:DNA polymerase-1|nr:MAG: DNA polymerase family A [Bacteriophage sp.]DAY77429.1 MAG TPA: DNA POLYMERASE [Caudoviricetes sp.]